MARRRHTSDFRTSASSDLPVPSRRAAPLRHVLAARSELAPRYVPALRVPRFCFRGFPQGALRESSPSCRGASRVRAGPNEPTARSRETRHEQRTYEHEADRGGGGARRGIRREEVLDADRRRLREPGRPGTSNSTTDRRTPRRQYSFARSTSATMETAPPRRMSWRSRRWVARGPPAGPRVGRPEAA